MNLNKFVEINTDYKSIVIRGVLLFALLLLLFIIEIFVFWGIFGEGATASRISELWYVQIILDYLPIILIGGYLVFKIFINYNNRKLIELKTNIIVLVILLLLFLVRNEIIGLIF